MGWLFWYFVGAVGAGLVVTRIAETVMSTAAMQWLRPFLFLGTTASTSAAISTGRFDRTTDKFRRAFTAVGKAVESFSDRQEKK